MLHAIEFEALVSFVSRMDDKYKAPLNPAPDGIPLSRKLRGFWKLTPQNVKSAAVPGPADDFERIGRSMMNQQDGNEIRMSADALIAAGDGRSRGAGNGGDARAGSDGRGVSAIAAV